MITLVDSLCTCRNLLSSFTTLNWYHHDGQRSESSARAIQRLHRRLSGSSDSGTLVRDMRRVCRLLCGAHYSRCDLRGLGQASSSSQEGIFVLGLARPGPGDRLVLAARGHRGCRRHHRGSHCEMDGTALLQTQSRFLCLLTCAMLYKAAKQGHVRGGKGHTVLHFTALPVHTKLVLL